MIRVRAGLYQSNTHQIEKLNEVAECYPGDDYYNMWCIRELGEYQDEIWLSHFNTLREAKLAIEQEKENDRG